MSTSKKNKTFYEVKDGNHHQVVTGISPTNVLQLEAVKRGDSELALLLPCKDSLEAAAQYHEMRCYEKDKEFLKQIQLQNHQMELNMVKMKAEMQVQQQQNLNVQVQQIVKVDQDGQKFLEIAPTQMEH